MMYKCPGCNATKEADQAPMCEACNMAMVPDTAAPLTDTPATPTPDAGSSEAPTDDTPAM